MKSPTMNISHLLRKEAAYTQLSTDEEYGQVPRQHPQQAKSPANKTSTIILLLLLAVLGVGSITHWVFATSPNRETRSTTCENPSTRREWRTLSIPQKHAYLSAVQCLKTKPSRLGLNHTLYDDFPYVHSRIGEYVHDAAPFLAWHRYFVHIYESALKQDCGYTGNIPFWNWLLDHSHLPSSPIFSAPHGFGSNGSISASTRPILQGYCVIDGPFANYSIPYLDSKPYPHCLSRGFASGAELAKQAAELSPEKIEQLLAMEGYEQFNLGLEHGPHLAVPRSVRGDFALLTAPSDPVFFLHHAQLDRLWWKWQTLHPERKFDYKGITEHGSEVLASTDDVLRMGGLAEDVKVAEVLDSRGGRLCYVY